MLPSDFCPKERKGEDVGKKIRVSLYAQAGESPEKFGEKNFFLKFFFPPFRGVTFAARKINKGFPLMSGWRGKGKGGFFDFSGGGGGFTTPQIHSVCWRYI